MGLFFGSCKFQKSVHVKIRSVNNALQPRCIWGLSCHVACHIKSTNGGYLELKRFLSWSMYCWEKGYITIVSNCWTHCKWESVSHSVVNSPVCCLVKHRRCWLLRGDALHFLTRRVRVWLRGSVVTCIHFAVGNQSSIQASNLVSGNYFVQRI